MLRYCPKCQKDIDFPIKSMRDLDSLVCPVCGSKVEKNSKNPERVDDSDSIETGIGNAISIFFRIIYLFYFLFALPSMFFYFFSMSKALYICTIINLVFYLWQLIFWGGRFRIGLILLPVGAAVAFYFFHSLQAACFGVQLVFLAYFVIRGLLYELLFRIIFKAAE